VPWNTGDERLGEKNRESETRTEDRELDYTVGIKKSGNGGLVDRRDRGKEF